MKFYNLSSSEMVFGLINSTNDTLPVELSASNTIIGDPVVVSGVQSRVVITPRFSSPYFRTREIVYDRINLNVLLRNVDIRISKSLRIPTGPAGTKVTTVYALLPEINATYGLSLTEDDIIDGDITKPASHNPVTGKYESGVVVSAKSTSLGYIGSFKFVWEMGGDKPHISQFLTDNRLRGFV